MSIDGIPGGASYIRYYNPVLTQECISQGRLAHVRTTNQGHMDSILFINLSSYRREVLHYIIQKVSQVHKVLSGNPNRIPNAQIVKLPNVGFLVDRVNLIDNQNDRLTGCAKDISNLFISWDNTLLAIYYKENYICFFNGQLRLKTHHFRDDMTLFVNKLNPPCINHCKLAIEPFCIKIDTVTGYAWNILYDGNPFIYNGIKQGRLAHIRSAYNCY